MSRPAWYDRARCATDPGPNFDREPLIVQLATCSQCPVRAECLAHALQYETPRSQNRTAGTWGGTTVKQRRQLLRRRAAA